MKTDSSEPRRRSIRLKRYDYSQEGAYFITICTRGGVNLFDNGRFRAMAEECWLALPLHFPMIELDEWVLMPNHLHGILVVEYAQGTACRAPTGRLERFGQPTSGSIPTIVRSFKSAASRSINILRDTPRAAVWQSNYYEHVIRSEEELGQVRQYIIDNPAKWEMDEYNPFRELVQQRQPGSPVW